MILCFSHFLSFSETKRIKNSLLWSYCTFFSSLISYESNQREKEERVKEVTETDRDGHEDITNKGKMYTYNNQRAREVLTKNLKGKWSFISLVSIIFFPDVKCLPSLIPFPGHLPLLIFVLRAESSTIKSSTKTRQDSTTRKRNVERRGSRGKEQWDEEKEFTQYSTSLFFLEAQKYIYAICFYLLSSFFVSATLFSFVMELTLPSHITFLLSRDLSTFMTSDLNVLLALNWCRKMTEQVLRLVLFFDLNSHLVIVSHFMKEHPP